MKTKSIIVLAITLMFAGVSCKCHKRHNEQPQIVSTGATTNPVVYRFIASFISKGAGIDSKSNDAILSYINSYNNQNNIVLKYDVVSWGKEGEKDYCFVLSELKTQEQEEFIKGFKKVTGFSKLVLFSENQSSVHKKKTPILEKPDTLNDINDTYRLIVSFISKGTGTDKTAVELVENYISDFNKANNVTLVVERYSWGREGEKDYCLPLTELTSEKQVAFIQNLKDLVENSVRVFVKENEICRHKK